ncbi:MAG: exodeoxyribonuclease III [Rhizobiales bacterium]|nr:exodeoxyribonuclease III [Hyphomicrobiales bacterium]
MQLKISTWNVNSVRFRIDLVARFIKTTRPDILCLQETKCPDDKFPHKRFKRLGYEHTALNGQKGYHGVGVLSRLPFDFISIRVFCGKSDSRHISVKLGERAGLRDPITLHNLYVPAGGDVPDPSTNEKFSHKLAFLDEMRECLELIPGRHERAILLGDLNVAPLEHDVWNHKQLLDVVSHTPIECDKLIAAQTRASWIDTLRTFVPEPTKLFTWWSYRSPDWATADKGRRLDHIWVSPALADRVARIKVSKEARGWKRPSDHAPVTTVLDVQ